MTPWEVYNHRMESKGGSVRGARFKREVRFINERLPDNLSYHSAVIDEQEREVAIINSDNLNEKTIISMPGEDFKCGGLVKWMNNYWIITEKDANNELYTKGKLEQCNYVLRWVAKDGNIVERHCIISDGTKYMRGESVPDMGYDSNGVYVGDTRIALTLSRDEYTVKLRRDQRFLIDDEESEQPLAYSLTKPYKIGGVYNGEGAMRFILSEVNTTDNDNFELMIADYYKYFPKEGATAVTKPGESKDDSGKRVWL